MKLSNNDILRRLRYIFDFNDNKMVKIFALAERPATRAMISSWLKREDDAGFQSCDDIALAAFLDGVIILRRGKQSSAVPEIESYLDNNTILRKLKIALALKNEDIVAIMALADFKLSKNELSAFFRRKTHKNYRRCKDQILRNFLVGLQRQYRP